MTYLAPRYLRSSAAAFALAVRRRCQRRLKMGSSPLSLLIHGAMAFFGREISVVGGIEI